MKHLKKFEGYTDSAENSGLYDKMTDLLQKGNELLSKFHGSDDCEYGVSPESMVDYLADVAGEYEDEAEKLIDEIVKLDNQIDEIEAESYLSDDEEDEDESNMNDEDETPDASLGWFSSYGDVVNDEADAPAGGILGADSNRNPNKWSGNLE